MPANKSRIVRILAGKRVHKIRVIREHYLDRADDANQGSIWPRKILDYENDGLIALIRPTCEKG